MDLNNCLVRMIDSYMAYRTLSNKIKAGFASLKDLHSTTDYDVLNHLIKEDIRDIHDALYKLNWYPNSRLMYLVTAVFSGNRYYIDKYWILNLNRCRIYFLLNRLLEEQKFKTIRYILEKEINSRSRSISFHKKLEYSISSGSVRITKKLFSRMEPGSAWGLWKLPSSGLQPSINELLSYAKGKERITKFLEEENERAWGKMR